MDYQGRFDRPNTYDEGDGDSRGRRFDEERGQEYGRRGMRGQGQDQGYGRPSYGSERNEDPRSFQSQRSGYEQREQNDWGGGGEGRYAGTGYGRGQEQSRVEGGRYSEGLTGSLYGQGREPQGSWRPGVGGFERGSGMRQSQGGRGSDFGFRGGNSGSEDRWSQGSFGSVGGYGRGEEFSGRESGSSRGLGFSGESEGADFSRQRYGGSYGLGYSGSERGSMMSASAGRFAGKGPKGYARSDERIKEQVSERLEEDHNIDATEITVEVKNGEVTLEGSVEDRWMKRQAEDLVEQCSGVKQVHNRIRVEKSDGKGNGESRLGSGTSYSSSKEPSGSQGSPTGSTGSDKSSRSRSNA